MTITVSDGVTLVELSPDLLWSDEFNWSPVDQTAEPSITGALIVMATKRLAGRPITLEPEDDNSGWMLRDVIEQLRNWAAQPGLALQLTLRGTTRDVIFRHQDGALDARPVVHYSEMDASDFYLATLKFMEV
jgi:hypothetical protein